MQCHETGRTLQVPGHLTRSVRPTLDGQPAFRHGTTDIDQHTPIADRFGGWYVTGDNFEHVGNQVLPDADEPEITEPIDLSTISNVDAYPELTASVKRRIEGPAEDLL